VWRKKNACFSNNCNFVYFQYKKNYVNTKTTCNKCSFDYLHWLLIYGKLYRKDGVLLAVHASGTSPQSSASHLLTFLVAQLQFLREWKLSDRRLYEVFERRLLIWGNPKERNRRQINLVSVGGPRDIAETRDYVLRKHLSNNCHRSPCRVGCGSILLEPHFFHINP